MAEPKAKVRCYQKYTNREFMKSLPPIRIKRSARRYNADELLKSTVESTAAEKSEVSEAVSSRQKLERYGKIYRRREE